MGFTDFLRDIFSYFGLFPKDAKIVFLGLDNAGKTTLLHMLKNDRLSQQVPTLHASNLAFDLGGHTQGTFIINDRLARRYWQNYFPELDGVVFMVDAKDVGRHEEASRELQVRFLADIQHLLTMEAISHVPFVILGNKIDDPGAISEESLKMALNIQGTTTGKDVAPRNDVRPLEIFMCSVVKRVGYREALTWLSKNMK